MKAVMNLHKIQKIEHTPDLSDMSDLLASSLIPNV